MGPFKKRRCFLFFFPLTIFLLFYQNLFADSRQEYPLDGGNVPASPQPYRQDVPTLLQTKTEPDQPYVDQLIDEDSGFRPADKQQPFRIRKHLAGG